MTIATFLELFQQYGLLLLFAVFFLESMNLPGFPAGVIMPATGVLVSQSQVNLVVTILLSVFAGILGSVVIYFLCFVGGSKYAYQFAAKHKSAQRFVAVSQRYIDRYHGWGIALCRIIPVLRTIVSIPAGLLRLSPMLFIPWSMLGIFVWNTSLISFGYLFSYLFIP